MDWGKINVYPVLRIEVFKETNASVNLSILSHNQYANYATTHVLLVAILVKIIVLIVMVRILDRKIKISVRA